MRLRNCVQNKSSVITVCEKSHCTGCMVCVEVCPSKAISIKDTLSEYNAVINETLCINCDLCKKNCQVNNEIELKMPKYWYQGWAKNDDIRKSASSGGIATALSYSFIESGGIVCSCLYTNGEFKFSFTNNTNELVQYTGSKYVKSNPIGIYKKIKKYLDSDEKVLFIGLPCQVNALRLYIGESLQEKLYTVDLICHGTPSPQLFLDYMKQCNVDIKKIKDIQFRTKNIFGIKIDGNTIFRRGVVDAYLLAFLCGVDYTDNCYSCKYATIKRGSDITIGDSWGSDLAKEEQKRGVSLILCQTDKGESLVKNSNVFLTNVNLDKAIQANEQLREPIKKTNRRIRFFYKYKNGNFKKAAFWGLPNKTIRQKIKSILIKYNFINIE